MNHRRYIAWFLSSARVILETPRNGTQAVPYGFAGGWILSPAQVISETLHGDESSPLHCVVPFNHTGCIRNVAGGCSHPHGVRPEFSGLSHGLKTLHRSVFTAATLPPPFRVPFGILLRGTPEETRYIMVSQRLAAATELPLAVPFRWFESLPAQKNQAILLDDLIFWYAGRDSNPRPTDS